METEEIERDEDYNSSAERRAEAYHQYELDIATMKGDKPDFETWLSLVQDDNDRYETEQSALANTR